MAITIEELQIKFSAEMGNLNAQLDGVKKSLGGLEGSAGKAQSALSMLAKGGLAVFAAKAGKALIGVGKDALTMANDVVESEQLFEVSMGKMTAKATKWSDDLGKALGLNPYELRKNAGVFNVMFESMGASSDEAYEMSTGLTKLANDMASFYNLDPEEAFNKLRSGITGQTMPLQALGILVDEQTVAQYAMEAGISKTGKAMTSAQKLQARYGAIMKQTAKAQGDLARTMDSPANQLRILSNQFDQAKIALGQALQPALIAVLPHMTNFATGLARVMSGGGLTTGNPFDDVVTNLADATASVRRGVSDLTTETVKTIDGLKTDVETALNDFATAASKTKEIYLDFTFGTHLTAYERVLDELGKLDTFVGIEAARGIQKDIQLLMDAALEDGVVTEEEVAAVRKALADKVTAILKGLEEQKIKDKAEVELKLAKGEISTEQAHADMQAIDDAYAAKVGAIKAIEMEVNANLSIKDWTANTLSPTDLEGARKVMQAEMDAAEAVALKAKATATATFEGTGLVGAVDLVYSDAITRLGELNTQMNDLFAAALDGAEFDWAKANELRQEMADIVQFITEGITSEGKFSKALFDLDVADPKTITNFANAYANTAAELTQAEQELLNKREDLLFSLKGDQLDKALADFGYDSLEQAIAEIRKLKADAETKIQTDLITSAADKLGPSIQKILADAENAKYGDVISLTEGLDSLLGKVDKSKLDAAGKARFDELQGLRDYLSELSMWLLDRGQYGSDTVGQYPAFQGPQNAPPKLTQYYDPMKYENKGLVFSGADITISNPRMQYKSMTDGSSVLMGGKGGSFDVNVDVAPQDIVVNMYLDEIQFGRANIRATQTVTKSTGGGKTLLSVPMQVIN